MNVQEASHNKKSHFPTETLTPGLQVTPSWLSPGASVTLTCSLEHPSAGWRFFWYKAVPKLPNSYYSYEMLPGSINGTTQDSYIVSGQTHTAGYVCRAGRGDPVQHTYHSGSKFVWCRGQFFPLSTSSSPFSPFRCFSVTNMSPEVKSMSPLYIHAFIHVVHVVWCCCWWIPLNRAVSDLLLILLDFLQM